MSEPTGLAHPSGSVISHYHCPRCTTAMIPGESAERKLWECPDCHGRLVSLYALRWICEEKSVNVLWKRVIQRNHPGPLPCPVCSKFMFELPLASREQAIEVDACRSCHMLWFDTGELGTLPRWRPSKLNTTDALPQAARERLALARVEQISEQATRDEQGEMPSELWQVAASFIGLPVEYDNPSAATPLITWSIAAACILVFLLTLSAGADGVYAAWGFLPAEPFRHLGATLVTSFFLHAGWFHLIGNLYFLLVFGDNVEEALGYRRYLLLLLAATLAGAALHGLGDPRSDIPCVGASGGISGVITLYALRFPQARLGIMFRYFLYFRWISFPAWAGLGMWGAMQFLLVIQQTAGFSNISALAHLGGASVGFLFWLWLKAAPNK